jgi:chromosome segregation ATPase
MAAITKKDIFDTLSEFYGKIVEPAFKEIRKKLNEHDEKLKDILEHFDKIYTKLDRLGTEYLSIVAAIERIEKKLDNIEHGQNLINGKLDREISIRENLEKEIKELKQRVSLLQERIEDLEKRLKTFS